MSYIKIELGGKERGLKFNQLAKEILQLKGNQLYHTKNVYALFFAGLMGCSEVKEEEPDYTYEDVCGWVDELYNLKGKEAADELVQKVSDIFLSTIKHPAIVEDAKPEEEKKRQEETES